MWIIPEGRGSSMPPCLQCYGQDDRNQLRSNIMHHQMLFLVCTWSSRCGLKSRQCLKRKICFRFV